MKKYYDIAIIGGGTVGSMIFLDAVSRGFSCVLIEKNKVGLGTNKASLGLIQTGLNYLYKDRDFVWMNAIDSEFINHILGDFLKRKRFLIPIFSGSKYPLWLWDGYLAAYDQFRKSNHPDHRLLSKKETLFKEPFLKKEVNGGAMFCEWTTDPVLLTKAVVKTGQMLGGELLEGAEAREAFSETRNNISNIRYLRIKQNEIFRWIEASLFINAAGPWTPKVLSETFSVAPIETRLTKGVSIVVRKRFTNSAVVLFDESHKYIAVLPLSRRKTLIGPTNTDIDENLKNDPQKVQAEKREISELINIVRRYFKIKIAENLICEIRAGLRPQLAHKKAAPDRISHDFMIIDHEKRDKISNLITVFGGKLSNQVRMAKETVDLASLKLGCKRLWQMPFLKITKEKASKTYSKESFKFLNLYQKKYALSYNDDINKIAWRKKIKAVWRLLPFLIYGLWQNFIKKLKGAIKCRKTRLKTN
ncbi:MAG: FAD-dependent oxidoreductase [Patescibacteria group bacterium]